MKFFKLFILSLSVAFLLVGCATQRNEIRKLGEVDESGVPKLVEASSDIRVRWDAYGSLIKLGPKAKSALPVLLKRLASPQTRDYSNYSWPQGRTPNAPMPSFSTPKADRIYESEGQKIFVEAWFVFSVNGMSGVALYIEGKSPFDTKRLFAFEEQDVAAIIQTIGAIGPDAAEAVPALIPFLYDKQTWRGKLIKDGKTSTIVLSYYPLRCAAASALAKIGSSPELVLPNLKNALAEERRRMEQGYRDKKCYEAMKEALSKIEGIPDLGRVEQLKPPTASPEVSPSSSISKEYVKQGLSHAKAGRHNEAAEAFKNATLNNPNDALAHYNLSVSYVYLKRFREAVESGEKAINIRPDFAQAYANLCAAYGGLKRYQEAVEACNKAIAFKPDYAEAYVNLCLTYGHVGRYQEAVEPCKKAIGLNPNFAMAHYTLGIIYTKLRDKEAAIQQYKILKNLDESRANNLLRMIKEMP